MSSESSSSMKNDEPCVSGRLRITFEYRDEHTHGDWSRQQCELPSIEDCIELYGLGRDCDYRILGVEEI